MNVVLTINGTQTLLAPLNHAETAIRVRAERAMEYQLEGGCQVPIGSYAELINGELWLRAWSVRRTVRRWCAVNDAASRKMPSASASRWRKSCWIVAPATFSPPCMQEKRLDEYSGHPSVAPK